MSEWVSTPDKDISFEHCGRPAYWQGEQVYCSKCQTKLDGDMTEDERGILLRLTRVCPKAYSSVL